MSNARLKLDLKGFEKMLSQLQVAAKDIDRTASAAVTESAKIVENELRNAAAAKGVPSDITNQIKVNTAHQTDKYEAEVGWQMGNYDPRNPSAGYKAIFLNYGTVRRQTQAGNNRGEIPKPSQDQQFIHMAKKAARPKIKKIQREIIKKVVEDLEK